MTLENNQTFISPHNQRISRLDSRPHRKNGKATPDSYRFEYPTMASLVDAMISQEDNKFPCRQYASGCSFNDIVWQQAIGASRNMDYTHHSCNMGDEEKVLFNLVSVGIIDHQEFNKLHKWSSCSIRYSAIVANCLWALYKAEHTRNDRLEQELNALKGQVALMNTCLLAVDCYSFEANNKEKHNGLVMYVTNISDQLDLHRRSLIALQGGMCTCNSDGTPPVNGSGAAPSFSHSPPPSPPHDPTPPAPALTSSNVKSPIVALVENAKPIPVLPPCCAPCWTVVESSTTLRIITAEEEREIEDHLIGAWQAQGRAKDIPNILVGSESNETSIPRCDMPVMMLSQEQPQTLSLEARGYWMLSMMRAVMMMPNAMVHSHLRSSDHIGGELQLVFPILQEDFNLSGLSFSILSSSPANTSPRHQAMIANEQSSFFRSWNTTTIAHARGTRLHPYPPPSSVFTRANTAENCDEDFSDLGVNDFVLSHKVTTRRKLERLQGLVFAHSLLERGTYHAMEGIEVYNSPIEVLMGYTSLVGIMLAEEIALTNDVVGAVSITTRGTVAWVSELEDTRSHELLRIYTEMELANRDLTIGLLRARLNFMAPMEIDLTTMEEEEYISAPGTPPTSGHTSTTNISIRVETPELVVPEGVLIPIEDSSEEEEGVVPDEIEAPEPLGIILPRNTFNWQDERAQGREEYYCRQREEEERAREEPEFVPPPLYDDIFPDVVEADRLRYTARYSDGRSTGERGPSDAGPSGTSHDD
ncbi:hypothetical protein BDM02DRAFT_3191498 [Thelephora ganbajun]|uniref:Uncharacterized protein n=1 Tax=Thelephora ganbajun TaxID=370292 RepID=A0ACB6Z1X8_THEGA|nr:hypothetical protein BDM02DRAFT_3191498 [Thelephora ganbajun]